ncbi:MAG: adenylate/guanylate cyclase domain-containing protein [Chthoniobacterales bacterium]
MRSFLTFLIASFIAVALITGARLIGFFTIPDDLFTQWVGLSENASIVDNLGLLIISGVLTAALAWIAIAISSRPHRWAIGGICLLLLLTGAGTLALYDIIFPPVSSLFGMMLGFLSGNLLTCVGPGAQRRRFESMFGQTLSKRSQNQLFESMGSMQSEGRSAEVSVVSVHLSNSTELLRTLDPEDFSRMVQTYMNVTSDYLVEAGGFLDGGSGQMLRVIFGQPLEVEDHARLAGQAVLGLIQRLDKLNIESQSKWRHILDLHIGVATGKVVAGFFGNHRACPFTIVGEPVNLSQRLAAACAHYGTRTIIDPKTFQATQDELEVRPIDIVRFPNSSDQELYEILGPSGSLSPEREKGRDRFWRGVIFTREKKWSEAIEEFTKARISGIPDPLLDYYLHRIEREKNSGDFVASGIRDLPAV